MRIGGPVLEKYDTPDQWLACVVRMGYRAVFFPVEWDAGRTVIDEYAGLARDNDIIIAEVGAWSNPMSGDETQRKKAIEYCQRQLELAEYIGAKCCVNIAGSLGERWDGPHRDSFSDEAFEKIVYTTREIIDHVRPERTFYTLEMMPWMLPDSPDSFLELHKAVDRPGFGAHLDVVNIINSPRRYYDNAALIRECFQKLGPHIKSCHAKDIIMGDRLTVHLDETVPGRGVLDYTTYIRCLDALNPELPLMVEHIGEQGELQEAVDYIVNKL